MSHFLPLPRSSWCLLLAAAMRAQAAPSDPLHLTAGLGYFHDDNLFRLANGQAGYDNQRADAARYATAGLLFDKAHGRQKLKLEAKLSRVKFNHFSQLDYDGKDYLGLLNWQLGNHWEGSAGASYAQTLAPYTDLRSNERNLRVHKRAHGDAAWRFHPRWRVRGAAARERYTYDLPLQRVNNRTENTLEAGVDFLPSSGSTAGLVARRVRGNYLAGRPGDDFVQTELKAKVLWKFSAISSVELLAGHARRKHQGQGQRDASGFNGRLTASLNPRQKLRLNAVAWREFAPIESTLVTYSLNRGASVGGSWDATAKLRLEADLRSERRAYQGGARAGAPAEVRDTLRQATLSATWSPRPTVQVNTAIAHQRRSGAAFLGNGSFRANTVSVSARSQF